MAASIEIQTASYAIAKAPDSLATVAIGSCMAICLFSQSRQTGALIHCMLPRAGQYVPNPYLYADTAISDVLEKLLHIGINRADLTAKIIGGSQMFPSLEPGDQTIGQRNADEVNRLLSEVGIPVVSSDVGGNRGRSILFHLDTGNVEVTATFTSEVHNI